MDSYFVLEANNPCFITTYPLSFLVEPAFLNGIEAFIWALYRFFFGKSECVKARLSDLKNIENSFSKKELLKC
jgi:hypothetical protein